MEAATLEAAAGVGAVAGVKLRTMEVVAAAIVAAAMEAAATETAVGIVSRTDMQAIGECLLC